VQVSFLNTSYSVPTENIVFNIQLYSVKRPLIIHQNQTYKDLSIVSCVSLKGNKSY